jgi:hypothetical protein
MHTNKRNVNGPDTGNESFRHSHQALKNRLRWRIRSAQRALKAKARLESHAAEARLPIYEIGCDSGAPSSDYVADKVRR